MKIGILYIFSLLIAFSPAWGQSTQPHSEKGFALFSIMQDTAAPNPFTYKFTDKSNGDIISWKWDFGDGETSDKRQNTHEYEEPGIYTVCLTIKTQQNGVVDESVTCKKVRVAEKGYFNLGGHVFVNQFPIDGGLAFLYAFDDNNKLHLVDSCEFDTLGFYYFYQQVEGRYIVKAEAAHDLGQYASYMPTYYGNVTKWQDANIIQFDTTMWEYNVNLSRTSYNYNGNGKISGTIKYDSSNLRNFNASNIPIYIFDEEGRQSCTYSNLQGEFSFDQLHHGDYEVRAEITGMHAVPVFKNINSEAQENITVNLLIKDEQVIADIPEDLYNLEKKISQPYPNPAKNEVRLKMTSLIDKEFHIKVYDQMGRLVYVTDTHMNSHNDIVSINTSNFAKGIYSIEISSGRTGDGPLRRFIKR